MAHSRTIQISVVMLTLMALVAWGCSGADDGGQPRPCLRRTSR